VQRAKMSTELGVVQPGALVEGERRTVATHEAGHATVAWLVAPDRHLEVLSIIKRGAALGLLAHSEAEERWTRTRSQMYNNIRIAMGGLVAEQLFFGETSSGVAGDLHSATQAAAQMVGAFGMAGSLISLEALDGPGRGNLVSKVLGEDRSREAVEAILEQAKDEVTALLAERGHLVAALRDALLERDELIGQEIVDVLVVADSLPPTTTLDLRPPTLVL
jgi:cell division protease FtsH